MSDIAPDVVPRHYPRPDILNYDDTPAAAESENRRRLGLSSSRSLCTRCSSLKSYLAELGSKYSPSSSFLARVRRDNFALHIVDDSPPRASRTGKKEEKGEEERPRLASSRCINIARAREITLYRRFGMFALERNCDASVE